MFKNSKMFSFLHSEQLNWNVHTRNLILEKIHVDFKMEAYGKPL